MEFTDGNFLHLAIVPNPRHKRANIVINSRDKLAVENYNKNQKRDEIGRWTKEDYNNEIDKILKGEYTTADKIKVLDHPSKPWLEYAKIQDVPIILTVKTYKKATEEKHNVSEQTMRNLPNLLNNPLYIFKSSTVSGSYVGVLEDFEAEKEIKKPLIAIIKPEQNKISVNLIPSIYGKDPNFIDREIGKGCLIYKRKDVQNKTVSNNIVASIATETLKPSIDIINYVMQNFNPMLKDNQAVNSIENRKGLTMAVLEELKDFIKGVVENAIEKEDKRKLIDEIGGILKGKIDEELWRTVVGKIEKIAYEKSETGTADNKRKK